MIPAIVIDASEADCYLMSLVENLAPAPQLDRSDQRHRQPEGARLLLEQIAEKTNLGQSYVTGVVTLMRDGEERLVNAVEKGTSRSPSPSTSPARTTARSRRCWRKPTRAAPCAAIA